MTIYVDEVFVVNFVMDFALLWAVGKLGKLAHSKVTLLWGAFLGAIYAIIIFLPFGEVLAGLGGKFACSILMVLVAYRVRRWQALVKSLAYLYLVAFVMGGAVIAAMYVFGERFVQTWNGVALVMIDFKVVWLAFGLLAVIVLVFWIRKPLERDIQSAPWLVNVRFGFDGQEITITALMDTGNRLSDPISHHPVIIMEYEQLRELLPEKLRQLYQQKQAPAIDELLLATEGTNFAYKSRIIPYHSVGQEHGVLLGFKADWLAIRDGQQVYYHDDTIIAIHQQLLSPYGTYQGLAHPDLLVV